MHDVRLHVVLLPASLGTAAMFAACAALPASVGDADAASAVEWQCDTLSFTVRYRGDNAIVQMAERTVNLPRAVSASGARYTDGTWTYWEHQGTARLETPTRTYDGCVRA